MFCTNVVLLIFHFITATAGTSAAGGTSVAGGTSSTGVEVDPHSSVESSEITKCRVLHGTKEKGMFHAVVTECLEKTR